MRNYQESKCRPNKAHHWDIDQAGHGVCRHCKEERDFKVGFGGAVKTITRLGVHTPFVPKESSSLPPHDEENG